MGLDIKTACARYGLDAEALRTIDVAPSNALDLRTGKDTAKAKRAREQLTHYLHLAGMPKAFFQHASARDMLSVAHMLATGGRTTIQATYNTDLGGAVRALQARGFHTACVRWDGNFLRGFYPTMLRDSSILWTRNN